MRILPAALAISVVLHTGAIAWVHAHKVVDLQALRPVTPPIEVEIVPTTVALLDDHTVKDLPEVASPARNTSGAVATPAHRGTATGRISTGSTGPEIKSAEPGGHSKYMGMRGGDAKVTRGVSGDFLDRFLDNSKPLDPETLALRAVEAAIDHGTDAHGIRHHGTGYQAKDTPYDANIEADGTTHLKDKPTFDATDALMRNHGMDPYASKKLKWLDDTREERYRIGKQYKHEQLGKSAQLAKRNVDYLWAKTTDLAARKQGLFELWDDCVETGSDNDLVEGGRAARRLIVGIIRARLTGSDAYTAPELAAFNAHKKSTATFSPYDE